MKLQNFTDHIQARSFALIGFCILSVLASSCSSSEVTVSEDISAPCVASPSSLLNWWDGSKVSDSIALNLLGNEINGLMTSSVSALLGPTSLLKSSLSTSNAFSLGNYASSITVPNNPALALTDNISVSAWVYSDNFQRIKGQSLFSKGSRSNGINNISSFTTTTSTLSVPNPNTGFTGLNAYDGKYVYYAFCGSTQARILRYDTALDFTSTSAWLSVNLASLTGSIACPDSFFDGRYLYLNGSTASQILIYDTSKTFDDLSSWTSNIVSFLPTSPGAAAFDGRYYYFPSYPVGLMRFDPQNSDGFTSANSWAFTYQGTLSIAAKNVGFDGRYIYLIKNFSNGDIYRFDTLGTFSSASSWTTYNYGGNEFYGAQFDGRYLYFGSQGIKIGRYDISGDFTSSSSWSLFDFKAIPGLGALTYQYTQGSSFDGRYLYYLPFNSSSSHYFLRYDTTLSFTDANSWERSSAVAGGFTGNNNNSYGGVFDGRYVYTPAYRWSAITYRLDTGSQTVSFDLRVNNSSGDGRGGSMFLGPAFNITTSNGYFSTVSKTPLVSSAWHYIVGTYDGSAVKLYVDGVLAASTPASGSMIVTSDDLKIGSFEAGKASFKGLVKDVQIYKSALDSASIQSMYTDELCK